MTEEFINYFYTSGKNDPDANRWIYLYLSFINETNGYTDWD